MSPPLLALRQVEAGYGPVQVLWSVSLSIEPGQVATLLGRNGMGKSTTVKSMIGQLPLCGGRIVFAGQDVTGWPDYRIARLGIGLVPEGRGIFPNLSVRENIASGAVGRPKVRDGWTLDRVHALFPRLQERECHLGCHLSGGEQQMLAIARALMTNPRLLVLDEATEGLAPLIRQEIWQCLHQLKRSGLAMLVIDKNLGPLSRLADTHYVVEKGRIVWQGDTRALEAERAAVQGYIGV